ncbi:MAG: hypothetical protein IPJ34_15665 [Myxococcales bacterium]|nr:hypothetical protein [Myxococcales bacterium]
MSRWIAWILVGALAACAGARGPVEPSGSNDSECRPPAPTPEGAYRPGWDKAGLAADLATLQADVGPSSAVSPSEAFASAKRALDAEKWLDAAAGFRAVAKSTTEERWTRQQAQYYLAVALYKLTFYNEAGALMRSIRATAGHPKAEMATTWLHAKWCDG